MQALDAELFFLFEDLVSVRESSNENEGILDDFATRKLKRYVPSNFTEYQMMTWASLIRGIVWARNPELLVQFPNCQVFNHYWIRNLKIFDVYGIHEFANNSQIPTGVHMDEFLNLTTHVCEHFDKHFWDLYDKNHDTELMHGALTVEEKYLFIEDFVHERKRRFDVNQEIFEHFHGNPDFTSKWHSYQVGDERPEYETDHQPHHIADGIQQLFLRRQKRENYKDAKSEIERRIKAVVKQLEYSSIEEMEEVLKYIKYGSKHNDLKYFRKRVQDQLISRRLPTQEKKRTLVELGGMEILEEDIRSYEELDPLKATIDEAFQISWLIPPDGGYYYYQGSSPFPPCFRAQNVIVFKRPIKMSKRQIQILTRIPTSFDISEDVQFTTPHVHDTMFEVELSAPDTEKSRIEEVIVPVYNQPRNHLFLGHDGVQKNAVEEWNKILEARKNEGVIGVQKPMIVVTVMMYLCGFL